MSPVLAVADMKVGIRIPLLLVVKAVGFADNMDYKVAEMVVAYNQILEGLVEGQQAFAGAIESVALPEVVRVAVVVVAVADLLLRYFAKMKAEYIHPGCNHLVNLYYP
ncbi:MAG: hypothetical protein UW03_C0013G0001 [Candidatus Peregrinibacteria bacterium GW2011_GWA2_43_8]|nr:MAG: hypothetical protein UW03_C0013G0001 [Candidatus Peregrinibacteria bacterium GW2011_GWA2_43_8]